MFGTLFTKVFPEYLHPYAKTLLIYGLIGYIIRLVVAPVSWLPQDFIATTWNQYVIVHNGIFDYFRYYPSVVTPAFSYIYTPWMKIVDLIVPGFYDPYIRSIIGTHPVLYANYPDINWEFFTGVASDPKFFQFVFLMKLPMFFFDFGIALILIRFINNSSKSLLVYKLWMLNPLTIYAVFIMGELHVLISMFFLLLGLYMAIKSPGYKWALVLGISALIWHLALVFLPIIALFMRKNRDRWYPFKFMLISISLWAVQAIALQLLLTGRDAVAGYRPGVLFASPFLNQGMSLDLTMGFKLVMFPLLYALVFVFLAVSPQLKPNQICFFMVSFLAIFYSTLVFTPHWITWLTPFLILFMAESESRLVNSISFIIILLYPVYLVYWDSLTTVSLFQPLFPLIWTIQGPQGWLNQYGGPGFGLAIVNGARSLLCAGLIFLGWLAFKKIRSNKEVEE